MRSKLLTLLQTLVIGVVVAVAVAIAVGAVGLSAWMVVRWARKRFASS